MPEPENRLAAARERVAEARAVAVLTGAGISAESGVPTFRGPEGLWRHYRAEDLATPDAFARDPRLVWEWYDWRRGLIATAEPNPAHLALVFLERRCPTFTLITQNVDGLHRKAGSRSLIELHGNIWHVRCTRCGVIALNFEVPIPIPPVCAQGASPARGAGPARCGGLLRPHVVWFGESLDSLDLDHSIAAIREADLFLIIGTSGVVQPAASFAAHARAAGAYIVEINLAPGSSAEPDVTLIGRAAEILPRVMTD